MILLGETILYSCEQGSHKTILPLDSNTLGKKGGTLDYARNRQVQLRFHQTANDAAATINI